MNDKFLTFDQAQSALGKSRTSVYRMVWSGALTRHYRPKDPRTPLFLRSEVESLAEPAPKPARIA